MPVTPEFKERLKKITLRNTKVKHAKNKSWPMEKKIEVVSQSLVLGNLKLVAATTGVSHGVLRQWKIQPWWKELEAEIKQSQTAELDTKLTKIVDKSLEAVLDRVENGEYVYDKVENKVKRRPASLKDVHRVSVDMISKRELIRGNATERKETTQVSITEQLKVLAEEFAKWASKKKPEVIELEDKDVTDVTPLMKEDYESQGDEEDEMDSTFDATGEDYDSDEQDGLGSPDEGEQDQ